MKKLCFILLFIFCNSLIAQQDSLYAKKLGIVSADKMNVVYRGVNNPISIMVSNAKSFKATGLGLTYENEKYYLSPGQGLEAKIILEIILEDDSVVIEEYVFRIKNINKLIARINNRNCENCIVNMELSEIKEAIISIYVENYLFDFDFKVSSFIIMLPNNKTINVKGNSINEEVFNEIKKLKKNSEFQIFKVNYTEGLSGFFPSAGSIIVKIQ